MDCCRYRTLTSKYSTCWLAQPLVENTDKYFTCNSFRQRLPVDAGGEYGTSVHVGAGGASWLVVLVVTSPSMGLSKNQT